LTVSGGGAPVFFRFFHVYPEKPFQNLKYRDSPAG
jgi:hypothetical protein